MKRSHLWCALTWAIALANWANLILILAVAVVFAKWYGPESSRLAELLGILFLVLCIATWWVGIVFVFWPLLSRCELREQWALVEEALADRSSRARWVLYLRSFSSDERLQVAGRGYVGPVGTAGGFEVPIYRTLDDLLTAFRSSGEVIAVPRKAVKGAIAVKMAKGKWKPVLRRLINKACAIVFVIDGTPGLRWELGRIVATGCCQKTLFIKAEHVSQEEWGRFQKHASQLSITLPCFQHGGITFRCGVGEQPIIIGNYSLSSPSNAREKLSSSLRAITSALSEPGTRDCAAGSEGGHPDRSTAARVHGTGR